MKTARKNPSSFSLTVADRERLRQLAHHYGISQASIVELITREAVRHYHARYDPLYRSSSRHLQQRLVTIPHITLTLTKEAHQSLAALAQHLQLNKTGVLSKLLLDTYQAAGLQHGSGT